MYEFQYKYEFKYELIVCGIKRLYYFSDMVQQDMKEFDMKADEDRLKEIEANYSNMNIIKCLSQR